MKQIHPVLRTVFITGFLLSLMAGIQLFVLAEKTEQYFAWTIQSRLTAALLGGFFFGAMTFGYLAFREPVWENERGAVVGLLILLVLKLAATLMHLDAFHFSGQTYLASPSALYRHTAVTAMITAGIGGAKEPVTRLVKEDTYEEIRAAAVLALNAPEPEATPGTQALLPLMTAAWVGGVTI